MGKRASAARKVANVLLSIVLVLGLLPAPAFATTVDAKSGTSNAMAVDDAAINDEDQILDSVDVDLGSAEPEETLLANGENEPSDSPEASSDYSAEGPLDNDIPLVDEQAALASEGVPTPGWTKCGTCEWMIDDAGLLTVRPLSGLGRGELAGWDGENGAPWHEQRASIRSAVIEPGVSAGTCDGMFYGCTSLTTLDLSSFDTSSVTDMGYMFLGCSSLTTLDLSSFDTSKVTGMDWMFDGCPSLSALTLPAGADLSGAGLRDAVWRDSAGTGYATTTEMLAANAARESGAEAYAAIDAAPGWTRSGTCEWAIDGDGVLAVRPLSGLGRGELAGWSGNGGAPWYSQRASIWSARIEPGVSAGTCDGMFYGCSSLESLDLSGLDTSNVTNMPLMFSGCSSLKSLDLSSFDTSKVTDMGSMFSGCSSLKSLDLSSFDTSRVTDMGYMFSGCSSLESIYASRMFVTDKADARSSMFTNCESLIGGSGTAYIDDSIKYAHIDGGADNPGYFTGRRAKWEGDANGNNVLNAVDAQIAYEIATTDHYKNRSDYANMYTRSDVTHDGVVDAVDAFAIQRAALCGWDTF